MQRVALKEGYGGELWRRAGGGEGGGTGGEGSGMGGDTGGDESGGPDNSHDKSAIYKDESGLTIDGAIDEERCSRMTLGEKTEVAFCRTFRFQLQSAKNVKVRQQLCGYMGAMRSTPRGCYM